MKYRIKKTTEKDGSVNYTPQYRAWPLWLTVRVWADDVARKIRPMDSNTYIGYTGVKDTEEAAKIVIEHHKEINKGTKTSEIINV